MLQEIPRQKNYCTDTAPNTEYGVQNTNYKTIKKLCTYVPSKLSSLMKELKRSGKDF